MRIAKATLIRSWVWTTGLGLGVFAVLAFLDMRLKARHMHAASAELPDECAAERGVIARPSSFKEDVGGSASPLRRQSSSRRGSFPPSEPFMV